MVTQPFGVSPAQTYLRYWDLVSSLTVDMLIALWCGVEPSDIQQLQADRLSTHCVDAKRATIENTLRERRLDYIDKGIPYGDGKL